ncbi:hypothetical protein DPEC_G00315040 [Dallia pectoralis]|uniref:Uncharacterized protein n=1 Tax=Dallia pectoralis TaxID=75939 RepID=A0ACC2FC51_DALPE|nr:hypothetical protein DPEC_G00315040 [Dallia pectoralis]
MHTVSVCPGNSLCQVITEDKGLVIADPVEIEPSQRITPDGALNRAAISSPTDTIHLHREAPGVNAINAFTNRVILAGRRLGPGQANLPTSLTGVTPSSDPEVKVKFPKLCKSFLRSPPDLSKGHGAVARGGSPSGQEKVRKEGGGID